MTTKELRRMRAVHLTVQDLADRYQVVSKTVRRWALAGTAPVHMRIGGAIRFRLEDVEGWEDARSSDFEAYINSKERRADDA